MKVLWTVVVALVACTVAVEQIKSPSLKPRKENEGVGWKRRPYTEGECSGSVEWLFDETNSTLIISGNGPINCTNGTNSPWLDFQNETQYVEIKEGVTSIGENSFYNFKNLLSATIPSSVTLIGNKSFYGCSSLSYVSYLGTSNPSNSRDVLEKCDNLRFVCVPPA